MSAPAEIIQVVVAEHVVPEPGLADRRERRRHGLFLAVATTVAMLALTLEVLPDERVAFRGFSDWPLPHTCFSRAALGVSCPGCGLTRSFIYLARGDWRAAWQEHQLGWLMAGLVALQFPYRAWALANGGRRALGPRFATGLAVAVAILLIGNWALTWLAPFPTGLGKPVAAPIQNRGSGVRRFSEPNTTSWRTFQFHSATMGLVLGCTTPLFQADWHAISPPPGLSRQERRLIR